MHRQYTFVARFATLTCLLALAGCGADSASPGKALLSADLNGALPAIDIEKSTNGQDADLQPGPTIAVGDPITWTYVLTNTGDTPLDIFSLTDDQGVLIDCPLTSLEPGESMTCTGEGVAEAGQYANVAEVLATAPDGSVVGDVDASHYFGGDLPANPAIDIEKATNGQDADLPPGPDVLVGNPVQWAYVVTNVGDVPLTDVTVADDQGVAVSCPATTLAAGESMTCTGQGVALLGQYANLGTATGTAPDGTVVSDEDPSHYVGQPQPSNPAIDIEKATNGYDADDPTGPTLAVGAAVEWTYVVSNTGDVPLADVLVEDDQGVVVICPIDMLAPGETMTCLASGEVVAGQYANMATVTAAAPDGAVVSDADASHYFGVEPEGCSLGYWKNHVASWDGTGLDPNQPVDSVFAEAGTYPDVGAASLMDALWFKGGRTDQAKARLLLKQAVAALLNAAHPDVAYPRTVAEIVEAVDAALASGDRHAMLTLKSELDLDNNLGCPLGEPVGPAPTKRNRHRVGEPE